MHWSAEIQTKVNDPRKDRTTKRVNSRSLTKLLFRILQNSRKNGVINMADFKCRFYMADHMRVVRTPDFKSGGSGFNSLSDNLAGVVSR